MAHARTDELMTTAEIAEAFDVDASTVRRWRVLGCPASKRGRAIIHDPAAVAAWRKSRGMDTQPGGGASSPDLDAARLRKENALADKYELQVARERATLIDAETEYARHAENLAGIRDRMLMIPSAMAARVVHLSAVEAEGVLDQAIRDALQELAES